MWKCPECHEEIDRVNYSVSTSESGQADLYENRTNPSQSRVYANNHDNDNSEWNGDPEYSCPECGTNFELSQLEPLTEEELTGTIKSQPPEKSPEELFKIIKPERKISITQSSHTEDHNKGNMICKFCTHVFVFESKKEYKYEYKYEDTDEYFECPKCGKTNSKKEYKKLIEKRFFQKNRIKTIKLKKQNVIKTSIRKNNTMEKPNEPIRTEIQRPERIQTDTPS